MKKYTYLYCLSLFSLLTLVGADKLMADTYSNSESKTSTISEIYDASETPKRGPRPPVDLSKLSPDDYNPGVFRVKISSVYSSYFTGNSFTKNKSGIITTGLSDFDQLSQQYNIYDARMLAEALIDGGEKSSNPFIERHKEWGFHLWYEFRTADKGDLLQIVGQFQALESVEIAQPVFRIVSADTNEFYELAEDNSEVNAFKSQATTNDTRFNDQWNLQNVGQRGGISGVDISIAGAWKIERGSNDVVVAIIDGGVHIDHPDLAANIWRDAQGNAGYNFADKSNEIAPGNHATHVAGIVSAVSNNGIGVAGIAGGNGDAPGVALMVCQVFSDSRSDGFHLAPIFAADNGAAISQNSWTYAAPNVYDQLVLDAIDYFNTYGGGSVLDGGITIFSAGNRGSSDNYYPPFYEGTLAVASINNRDEKASTSNYGDWIDISAPGVSILSTLANDSYGYSSGTSMAAPHVAGVAALIVCNATTKMKASDVIDILISTADNHYAINEQFAGQLGSGRINAYAALLAIQPDDYQSDDPDDELADNPEDETSDNPEDGHTDDGDDESGDDLSDDEDGQNADPEEDNPDNTEPVEYHFLHQGDWNNLQNWYADAYGETPASTLPGSNSIIYISAHATSTETLILEGDVQLWIKAGGGLTLENMVIANCGTQSEKLVVLPGGFLTVLGDLINECGKNAITIVSDATGSGSIMHNSQDVQASLKRIYNDKTQFPWNTLSIPFLKHSVSHLDVMKGAFIWNEPEQNWMAVTDDGGDDDIDTNSSQGNDSGLEAGIGYLIDSSVESGSHTSIISGNLESGEFIFHLSRLGKSNDGFTGFNLIGNPYASSIDWSDDTGWSGRDNLDNGNVSTGATFWSWNPVTGNYGAYNNQSHADKGTNNLSRFISPMQAFWVRAKSHGTTFSVNGNARMHHTELDMKQSADSQNAGIRMLVTNYTNSYSDEIVIEFGHNQVGGSEKIFSLLQEAPSMYSSKDADLMSILFLPEINQHAKVDLGFVAGVDAVHSITAQSITGFGEEIYLVDKQTGHRHNLSQRDTYHFSASVYDDPDRFEVHFGEEVTTSVNHTDMEKPEIFYTSGQLNVNNPWNATAEVYIFNAAGACVAQFSTGANTQYQNSFTGKPGVYVVRMASHDKQFATRIVAL